MATKHAAIYYLKPLILILSEDVTDIDWDIVDELFQAASAKINNSLAEYHTPKQPKQAELPLSAPTPAHAQTEWRCPFCEASGLGALAVPHTCEASAWDAALKRQCVRCGGYVEVGEAAVEVPGLGGELVHKTDCLKEEKAEVAEVITDEARMLPAFNVVFGEGASEDLAAFVKEGGEPLPPYTQEQGQKLKEDGVAAGVRVFPWVCLTCGDAFSEYQRWEDHQTKSHGLYPANVAERAVKITLDGKDFWVLDGCTTVAAFTTAFKIEKLYAETINDDIAELTGDLILGDTLSQVEDIFFSQLPSLQDQMVGRKPGDPPMELGEHTPFTRSHNFGYEEAERERLADLAADNAKKDFTCQLCHVDQGSSGNLIGHDCPKTRMTPYPLSKHLRLIRQQMSEEQVKTKVNEAMKDYPESVTEIQAAGLKRTQVLVNSPVAPKKGKAAHA